MKAALILAALLVLMLVPTASAGSVYVPYGETLTITGSASYTSITGAGHNSLVITNASLNVGYISLRGPGTVSIVNSSITGLSKPITLNSYTGLSISNISISGFTADSAAFVLRGIKNSIIDSLSYTYSRNAVSTNMVAISIEGCTNLTMNRVYGIGLVNVRTPHFHVSFAGTGPSVGVVVSNSYFYGGGNGGTSSNVRYLNCTWDSVTDGTEVQKAGLTEFVGCTWRNVHDFEVNLQGGVVYRFVNCSFGEGLINAANGYAEFVNCTSPAWIWAELKDNDDVHKWLGSAVINDFKYSWVKVGDGYATKVQQVLRFAVISDYGVDDGGELLISELVKGWGPDFIVTTGDNNALGLGQWDRAVGKYYGEYVSTGRFYPTLGNHDWSSGVSGYVNYFALPGNERYYDFIKRFVHFYAVDESPNEPDGSTPTSAQAKWLKAQLSGSSSAWDIVYFHASPYTSSSYHSSTTRMRWGFAGADVVLTGHVHAYERLLEGGLTYMTMLSGGQPPQGFGSVIPGSQLRYSGSLGATLVTATETSLNFRSYTVSGVLVDDYTLSK